MKFFSVSDIFQYLSILIALLAIVVSAYALNRQVHVSKWTTNYTRLTETEKMICNHPDLLKLYGITDALLKKYNLKDYEVIYTLLLIRAGQEAMRLDKKGEEGLSPYRSHLLSNPKVTVIYKKILKDRMTFRTGFILLLDTALTSLQVVLRKANYSDISQIFDIAESHHYQLKSAEDLLNEGFLVSKYTIEDYKKFINNIEVLVCNNYVYGFILYFELSELTKYNINYNYIPNEYRDADNILLKQIGIYRGLENSGLAKRLMKEVFDKNKNKIFITAVVNEPYNQKSSKFLKSKDFKNFHHFKGDDGIERKLWKKIN